MNLHIINSDAEFLTPREAAERLRVGLHAVLRAIHAGTIPCVRLTPRTFRIPASAIDALRDAAAAGTNDANEDPS